MQKKTRNVWSRGRKGLCMLLSLMLICGTVSTGTVWAEEEKTNGSQIGNYFKADLGDGTLENEPTLGGAAENFYEDGKVRVNKTITPAGEENLFNIELTVSTQEEIDSSVTSADAAAVIVIDCSFSMYSEENGDRLGEAKKAAISFVDKFASENATRKVAVVKFSGWPGHNVDGAKTVLGWTDASALNMNTIEGSINMLETDGGTNIEAGLILAKNLLNQDLVNDNGDRIENKNVILLTDGKPTYGVDSSEDTSTSTTVICEGGKNTTGSGGSTTCQSIRDKGQYVENDTHLGAEAVAESMKDSGINTYAVYLGDDKVTCNDYRTCGLFDKTGKEWLEDDCGFDAYGVTKLDDLVKIFQGIAELIQKKAQAWIVTDPMGSNINFVKINDDYKSYNSDVKDVKDDSGNLNLVWNIKKSVPCETDKTDSTTTYIYKLSYQVRLNTLSDGYSAGSYYATNGVTGLTYLIIENNNGETSSKDGIAYFNVPSVRGYDAGFTFNKVDEFGKPLEGATFTLKHSEYCTCGIESARTWTASSSAEGTVEFANIPSGHKYTLSETEAPENYVKAGDYEIEIKYGVADIRNIADKKIENKRQRTSAIVTKKVEGNLGDRNKEFEFTAKAVNSDGELYTLTDGEYNDYSVEKGLISFNLKDGESVTINDLPVGATLLIEETNAAGYGISVSAKDTNGNDNLLDDSQVDTSVDNNTGSVAITKYLHVTFTNTKNVTVDTGIDDDISPMLLVGLAAITALLCAGIVCLLHRRKFD